MKKKISHLADLSIGGIITFLLISMISIIFLVKRKELREELHRYEEELFV